MSRPLSSELEVPAPVAAVFALRTSARWVELKCAQLSDGSTLVDRTAHADGSVTLVMARNLPAGAPSFLERFLPRDGKVVQTETWRAPDAAGACTGTWSVEIPGAPAQLGGASRLEPSGAGTRQRITGSAKISIPLVGGRAEQFVVDMSTRLIEREGQLMRQELAP